MRIKALVTVGIALVLAVAAFTGTEAANPKVRIGIGYALAYLPVYVAQEKGYFKDEGVDVEFVPIEIAPDMIQSIIGGSTDAGVGGSFAVISFVGRGAPVSTVAFYGYGGERVALAVRKGAGIKSLSDLYGKKLAVQTGTIAHQMWGNLVKVEKLDASKVDVKNLRNLDLPAAIGSGSIDALITWEPNPTILEDRGVVEILQRGGKYQKSYGCLVFGNKFIAENPDAVRRFVKAHFRGAQFARKHPREAAAINSKYVRGSTVDTLEKSAKYIVFDPRVTTAAVEDLAADIEFMRAGGRLGKAVSPKDFVIARFSDEVDKAHPDLTADLK